MKNAGNNIFPIFNDLLQKTDKEQLLKQKSFTVWMTGLSGSGKSTVAKGIGTLFTRARVFNTIT